MQPSFAPSSPAFPRSTTTPLPSAGSTFAGYRALIVEDDEILARFLHHILTHAGFAVEAAHDGLQALGMMRAELDVVILDLNLPGADGISVLQQARSQYSELGILVLTGRSRAESAVLALESGADDCVTKPFSHVELLARLRALLRRQKPAQNASSQCGGLLLNRITLQVTRDGEVIPLTPREFALLEYLMRAPGVPVPRSVLVKELWGETNAAGSNVVDVYMKYVRDKVDLPGKPRLIRTVRGIGYAVSES